MGTNVWMQHGEHHGKAAFPTDAAEQWALKGWEPCDPPVDPDPAMVEHQPRPVPQPEPSATADASESSTETEE